MEKKTLTREDISKIISGFDPIDWVQIELLAKMPPEKRLIPGLNAQEFSMAALRGTFRRKHPELSIAEINMKVLTYLTPIRIGQETLEMWNQVFAKAKEEIEKHRK